MKKMNLTILNIAIWIEIALSYILPFNVVDDEEYLVGFPFEYLTAYNNNLDVNPLRSMHINPLIFLANVAVIYLLLVALQIACRKMKSKKQKDDNTD